MTLEMVLASSKIVDWYLRGFVVPPSYPGNKEDLRQVGLLGLAKAYETHNKTKSSFNSWAWFYVRGFIRDEVKKHKPRTPSGFNEYFDPSEQYHNRIALTYLLKGIKDKDMELVARYVRGESLTEIGKKWRISRQAVSQRLERIIKKARE